MKKKSLTYTDVGVDISKIRESHKAIAEILKETFKVRQHRLGKVLTQIGHYAGLIDLGRGRHLALHTDGVGTKTIIASAMKKYDTIGIDCVAMNVNDLICIGAEPIALLDYLAIDKPTEHVIQEIMRGLVKGAKQARVAIVGGETAIMPELINGFDLAAMSVGILDKKLLITGKRVQKGDGIYGLGSTGIHSNGLTLARKVLLGHYKISDKPKELNWSIGEELLNPTKIYVDPVLEILSKCKVHGLAHITGGAFSKLRRLGDKHGFLMNNMPEPLLVFKLIQRLGNISDYEMYRTFNMGVGFCIIAPKGEQEKILSISQKNKCRFYNLGVISEKAGVIINGLKIA